MINEPKEPVCDDCRPLVDAFTTYSQDLDDHIRLIADLCLAVNADGEVSEHCISGIGTVLREYIDKQDVVKNYFFGTKISTLLCDEALDKSERVRIRERCKDIFGLKDEDVDLE